MPVFLETPVDVTPATLLSWEDVDVSAHVSAGATGVIMALTSTFDAGRAKGARIKSETDVYVPQQTRINSRFMIAGLDVSKVLSVYIEATWTVAWLIGYFESEAVFLPSRQTAIPLKDAWEDRSIAGIVGSDIPIAAIGVLATSCFVRESGSTDERNLASTPPSNSFIMKTTPAGVYQDRADLNSASYSIFGYMTDGYESVGVNSVDVTPGTPETWADLPALPATAVGALLEQYNPAAGTITCGARAKGDTEDVRTKSVTGNHNYIFSRCDANGVIQGFVSTGANLYLHGYFTSGSGPQPGIATNPLFFAQDW